MLSFLRAAGVTLFVLIALVLIGPGSASAQTATNQALSLDASRATALWKQCYESENKTNLFSCQLEAPGVSVSCSRDVAVAGDKCTYTYPDKSRIEADPNFFVGATFKNYDSTGKQVGSTNNTIGGESSGTLANSAGYDTGSECSASNFGCWLGRVPGMLFTGIAFLFLTLSSAILAIAGVVFNWVVIRTVFQFGEYFGTSEGMLIAWGVMRDIANIGLLFGFIFMGVLLILNVDGGGHGHGHGGGISAKRAIPRLIIFAVLLNFSLFASQAVIDVANAFSSSFAVLAGDQCDTTTSSGAGATGGQAVETCANDGIAGQILSAAGLTSIFSVEEGWSNVVGRPYSYAISLILLSIFVLVTAIVLIAGAIMLVIRVVVLSLLMVTSPIGFAGLAIPKLQGIASMWWSKLLSQAFFAPVYLLLIYISIKLTETLMQGDATLASAIIAKEGNTVAGNMQVVMVFLVVIGFMIASLIAASKMGAMGASFAANSATALVSGAATRGMNFGVGGGARLLRVAQQRTGFGGKAGEVAVNRMLRPLEKANLDWRRLPGASAGLGAAGIAAGAKPAEHATFADIEHQFSDIKSGKTGQKLHEEYEGEKKTKKLEDDAHHGTLDDGDKEHLASLSTKELEALHGIKEGLQSIAENLSPGQFEKLMDSKELTDLEKGKLKAGRYKRLNDAAASGNATSVKDLLKGMSKKDLENAPAGVLLQPLVLDNLSDQQRDDLTKNNDKVTPRISAGVKASYASEILKAAYAGGGAAAVINHPKFTGLSTKQYAKLGVDVLADPAIAANIPPAVLDKILKDDELDSAQMRRVGIAIDAGAAVGSATRTYITGPKRALWGL